jgi:hypothetical protein
MRTVLRPLLAVAALQAPNGDRLASPIFSLTYVSRRQRRHRADRHAAGLLKTLVSKRA